MNICIIAPAFPSNRNPIINIFIYRQAKALVKRGHKVFVVGGDTEPKKEGNMIVYARPNAIKSALLALKVALKIPKESFWLLKNIGLKGTIGRLSLVQMTCDLLKKEKIDIIDGHYADYGAVVAYLVSKIHKTKYVITCHGSDVGVVDDDVVGVLPSGRKEVVSKSAMAASCVILPSQSMANDMIRYCTKNKITIVHNSADLSFFKPVAQNIFKRKTVLDIGALNKRKGHLYLLKAIPAVLDEHPDVEFLIVGRGREEQNLKACAEELGISDSVKFIDFLPEGDLPAYYSSCEFFVSATSYEGLPVALIEAISCGAPIVSTNILSVQEVVGDAGILVEPRNPDQLAEAMLKLLNDEDLRHELSKKALEQSKKFSIEKRIKKIEEIYEKYGR